MKRNRIFLSLGMVLLISVFILFTNIGKNRAFSYTEETLGFLKEKCRGHPDDTGKFNDASYGSVVKLTAWLCRQLKLKSSDVVRHYDINGKKCPKYYVEDKEAWKQLKEDVKEQMKAD